MSASPIKKLSNHQPFCDTIRNDDEKHICQFCSRLEANPSLSTTSLRTANQLWRFLYHQNVRETQLSCGDDECDPSVPMLTFTLSVGPERGGSGLQEVQEPLKICEDCAMEFERLEKFHQQLKAVQESIQVQVKKISKIISQHTGDENISLNSAALPLSIIKGPRMELKFSGTTVGKENIENALKFPNCVFVGLPVPSSSSTATHLTTDKPPASNSNNSSCHDGYLAPLSSVSSTSTAAQSPDFSSTSSPPAAPPCPVINANFHLGYLPTTVHPRIRPEPSDDLNNTMLNVHQKEGCPFYFQEGTEPAEDMTPVFTKIVASSLSVISDDGPYNEGLCVPSESMTSYPPPEVPSHDPLDITVDVTDVAFEVKREFPLESIQVPESYLEEDPLAQTHDHGTSNDNNPRFFNPGRLRKPKSVKKKRGSGPNSTKSCRKKPCPICGKLFFVSYVKSHLKVHSGEKPYQCQICKGTFSRRYNFHRHSKLHKKPITFV